MNTPDKKEEILKAASDCFARYGYEKTTLDDIGKPVGLNKASLYYYFKNKESIYASVIFAEANQFVESVKAQVARAADCREKILTYFEQRLLFIKSSMNLSQLSKDSAEKIAPLFSNMYGELMEREISVLADVLDAGVKNGSIIPCESRKVAHSILTVSEAIRGRVDCHVSTDAAFEKILGETQYTISLILNGLRKE